MTKDEFYALVNRSRLTEILKQNETPCYLYFLDIIKNRVEKLKNHLPSCVSIHYAIKANPHPAILTYLASLGLGADTASVGELNAAMNSGMLPERIEFSGPGKTEEELLAAVKRGVGSINAESMDELRLLIKLSEQTDRIPNVGIRVNPDFSTIKSGLRMAGATPFGIPQDQLNEALKLLTNYSHQINFTGLHIHTGSQILDTQSILDCMRNTLDLAVEMENTSGLLMKKINFGGGWGINYFRNQYPLDLNRLASDLDGLFREPLYMPFLNRTEMIIEPGRFLTAECGVYAVEALYRKTVRSKEFVIVNGGMHHNYLLAGGMGQVIRRNFEMDILSKKEHPERREFSLNVAGRLCTPQDLLAIDYPCEQEVYPGDTIVFFNCGAYGLSASPTGFLSHPQPAEIVIS